MGVIEFKLSEVLGRHRINQRQLAAAAKVRPAAVNALYHGNRERVDVDQLASILDALNVMTGKAYTVADLLEYKPIEWPLEETAHLESNALDLNAHLNDLEQDTPADELNAWAAAFGGKSA